jgi:predicted RNA-binding Zn-ribbon protein involved in translation (DUF1610 family)
MEDAEVLYFKSLSQMMHREYIYDDDNNLQSVRLRHLSFRDANSTTKARPDLDKMWKKGKHPGSLLCLFKLPDNEEGDANRKHIALTSEEKGKKKRVRHAKFLVTADKAMAEVISCENNVKELEERSNLFYCPNCHKDIVTKKPFTKHVDSCNVDPSTKEMGKKSTMIRMVQQRALETVSTRSIEAKTPMTIEGSETMGHHYSPRPQACLKKTHPPSQHCAAVYEFVLFIHGERIVASPTSLELYR